MSPTALKQQITHLISELSTCYELCATIPSTRKLGSTHTSFDGLYTSLPLTIQTISAKSATLRKVIGSRMDLGDETSRNILTRAIKDVQTDIQPRLWNIAHPPPRDRRSGEQQVPGFKDILRQVTAMEFDVCDALESLSLRLQASKPTPAPTSTSAPYKANTSQPVNETHPQTPRTRKPREGDEVLVNIKELTQLLEHLKASWVEYSSEGRKYYVNAFDKTTTWERPEGGFVQSMPRERETRRWTVREERPRRDERERETRRSTVREERPRWDERERERIWEDGRGW
ncbi:hypothetical protein HYALB_00012345 [Hymenoscyphus albidus]|uniref:WW domain-containing protein n=1 Tax=Hymenoscyphus albidus TaxID=595503 RepID=A0A9N9LPH6_9HELO|nr:hypothetical protein HYALB_00012345 [Hymenoscyphus albidus]